MSRSHLIRWTVSLALILGLGCADEAPGPVPSTVNVNSVLDSILAVGKAVSLTAGVKDATGADISGLTLSWSSSNAGALTVNQSGLVTAVAAGNATISAALATPAVTGTLRMRAVQADLTTVTTLSGDAFGTVLINAVSMAQRPAVQTAWAKCASGASSGGVVAIMQCGSGVAAGAASATDPVDKVLISILQLYSDEAQRRLGL